MTFKISGENYNGIQSDLYIIKNCLTANEAKDIIRQEYDFEYDLEYCDEILPTEDIEDYDYDHLIDVDDIILY